MKLKFLKNSIIKNIEVHNKLINLHDEIKTASIKILNTFKKKKKIFICGNGGSAADAQHLSAEYLVRLRPNVNRKPIPAISLAQDTSTLTACSNDYNFSDVFIRPFQALAKKNDVLIAISTSGNSLNVIKVLKEARAKKITTIGFLGGSGGKCKKFCDIKLIVPNKSTARIQECHIFLGHFIFEQVENLLLKK